MIMIVSFVAGTFAPGSDRGWPDTGAGGSACPFRPCGGCYGFRPLSRGRLRPSQSEGGLTQVLVAPLARSALLAVVLPFARFPLGVRPFLRFSNPKTKGRGEDPRPGMRPVPRAFRSARGSLLRSSQGARADLGEVEVPEEPEEARRHAHDVPTSLARPEALVKRRFRPCPGRLSACEAAWPPACETAWHRACEAA